MSAVQVFTTRPAPFMAIFRGLLIVLGAVIFAATIIGQLKANRFPAYQDLAISAALPFVAYAFVSMLVLIGRQIFHVTVTPDELIGYGSFGQKIRTRWDAVTEVQVQLISEVPYLFLKLANRKQEMTIPLWLEDLPGFFAAIQQYTAPTHPLHQFVLAAAEKGLNKEPVTS